MGELQSRRKFTKEFKVEAVALSRQPGMTVAEAASDLGVPVNSLHRWRLVAWLLLLSSHAECDVLLVLCVAAQSDGQTSGRSSTRHA